MNQTDQKKARYAAYVQILKEELVPAMGCTEPAAIAYAAAKAREVLGCEPESCKMQVSGNIIKNVKSVVVPNTGGAKGIEAATAAGLAAGDAGAQLQVLAGIQPQDLPKIKALQAVCPIEVIPWEGDDVFYIESTVSAKGHRASVAIRGNHTNIVKICRDEALLFEAPQAQEDAEGGMTDRSILSVEGIIEFANEVELEEIQQVIEQQISCNSDISREGLQGGWGAEIGRTLLQAYGDDVAIRARAAAAAGSDARMGGCEKPVVIVSGSGNQGMTASLPVIEYAKELGCSREKMIRALALSDLITIHQKTGIGRLSAFCGAVSAGCGAAAGIAYLYGGGYEEISHTIVNTLAILSGMVCDGAKPSCAAKIAEAVDAGILGYKMFLNGKEFVGGDGIVKKGVENTIRSVGRMAKEGMRGTDQEVISIMVDR
jgi:L-cysteine desulfidase